MTRMNWDRLRYRGKPTLSIKDEFEQLKQQARADRWRRARRRNAQAGQHTFDLRRPISVTASSTEAPPW